MKIEINDHRKIAAIQEEFSSLFPNLIIEFYTKGSKPGSAHPDNLVKHNKTLGECRTQHNKGELTITAGMNANEIIEHFSDVYGLAAAIFKKSPTGRNPVQSKRSLEEENITI
ncbi:MAG: hypothetical protein ACXVPN_11735 [Bacteroidia bacterium]